MDRDCNAKLLSSAREYVFRRMPNIRGYLTPVDALAIAAVLIGQTNAKLSGGIAEIGVFFGRSFLLMATLLEENEKALAMDLFDIGLKAGEESGQLRSFLASAKTLKLSIDRDMVLVGSSQDFSAPTLLQKAGPLRFFSVDGGHLLRDVLWDAQLAAQTISEYGVICFDDFCNPEWPEVTLGVFDFLRNHADDFAPFMISQKKLFVCRKGYQKFYTEAIANSVLLRRVRKTSTEMMNNRIPLLRIGLAARVRYEALARAGLGAVNGSFF